MEVIVVLPSPITEYAFLFGSTDCLTPYSMLILTSTDDFDEPLLALNLALAFMIIAGEEGTAVLDGNFVTFYFTENLLSLLGLDCNSEISLCATDNSILLDPQPFAYPEGQNFVCCS